MFSKRVKKASVLICGFDPQLGGRGLFLDQSFGELKLLDGERDFYGSAKEKFGIFTAFKDKLLGFQTIVS